jgi:hypothetical protein
MPLNYPEGTVMLVYKPLGLIASGKHHTFLVFTYRDANNELRQKFIRYGPFPPGSPCSLQEIFDHKMRLIGRGITRFRMTRNPVATMASVKLPRLICLQYSPLSNGCPEDNPFFPSLVEAFRLAGTAA